MSAAYREGWDKIFGRKSDAIVVGWTYGIYDDDYIVNTDDGAGTKKRHTISATRFLNGNQPRLGIPLAAQLVGGFAPNYGATS